MKELSVVNLKALSSVDVVRVMILHSVPNWINFPSKQKNSEEIHRLKVTTDVVVNWERSVHCMYVCACACMCMHSCMCTSVVCVCVHTCRAGSEANNHAGSNLGLVCNTQECNYSSACA